MPKTNTKPLRDRAASLPSITRSLRELIIQEIAKLARALENSILLLKSFAVFVSIIQFYFLGAVSSGFLSNGHFEISFIG
jgi:hypothetical protein